MSENTSEAREIQTESERVEGLEELIEAQRLEVVLAPLNPNKKAILHALQVLDRIQGGKNV